MKKTTTPNYLTPAEPELRFVRQVDYNELINLYHLARAAGCITKYERMIWASKQWAKVHTYTSVSGAYKDLETSLQGY